jgi:hypothetical protein
MEHLADRRKSSCLILGHIASSNWIVTRYRAFDDYFKAYSVAFLPGPERPTLAYGGKGES